MFKKRYIAVFLIKELDSYTIIGKKLFNPSNVSENGISYKGNSYIIDTSERTFSKGLNQIYYIDKNTKDQLLFSEIKRKTSKVDTGIIDMIIRKKIIKQLTSELGNTDYKSLLMYIIIGGIVGGLIGWIAKGAI